MATPPNQNFWPDTSSADPKVHFALTIAQNAIQQHDQAFTLLKQQHDALAAQVATLVAAKT